MNDEQQHPATAAPIAGDLGEYCRHVEACLARANQGHLVRIAGTSFELVRQWARDGIPLSVACFGIERKAERHRQGVSRRPLRLEFCDDDVRAAFAQWSRAVGVAGVAAAHADSTAEPAGAQSGPRRGPSLGRRMDRAAERLVGAAGRLESPTAVREAVSTALDGLMALRDEARTARGEARDALLARLAILDRGLVDAVRDAARDDWQQAEAQARSELAAYRSRLSPAQWAHSVNAGATRLLRARFGLPTLDPDEM